MFATHFILILMIFLQSLDRVTTFSKGSDAEGGGFCAADGGHNRRISVNGGSADFDLIGARGLARRSVDDELEFAVFQEIDSVGPALGEFENAADFQTGFLQNSRGAAGGNEFETELGKKFAYFRHFAFMRVADADEDAARGGQGTA